MISLSLAAIAASFLAFAPVGSSKDKETFSVGIIKMQIPDGFVGEFEDKVAILRPGQDEEPIVVMHVTSFSTDKNYPINGKYYDGDAPKQLLGALVDIDAENNFAKKTRPGSVKKTKSKHVDYYMATNKGKRTPSEQSGAPDSEPVPYHVIHLFVKDKSTTGFEYVILHMQEKTAKAHSSQIKKMLQSLEYAGLGR